MCGGVSCQGSRVKAQRVQRLKSKGRNKISMGMPFLCLDFWSKLVSLVFSNQRHVEIL